VVRIGKKQNNMTMVGAGVLLIAIFQTLTSRRIVLCMRSIFPRTIIERIAKLKLSILPKICRIYIAVLARIRP
jgi:hypothetical protein